MNVVSEQWDGATVDDSFITPASHVHRNYQKRPIIIPADPDVKQGKHECIICHLKIDGVTYQRTTNFVGVLDDRYGLERYQERGVAEGLARRNDLLTAAAAAATLADEQAKKTRFDSICKEAKETVGHGEKAKLGTALHTLTEQLDRGEDVLIPPSAKQDLEAYRLATSSFKVIYVELFVVFDEFYVGGTTDRIIEYKGSRFIGDLKTGGLDYAEHKTAMQMAMYARSQRYDPATGERTPLGVDTSRGVCIHVPAGKGVATLRWADLDRAWRGIEICREVHGWRKERGLLDASEPGPALAELIAIAGDRDSLLQLHAHNAQIWTDELTQLAKQRITLLEGAS